MRRKGTWTTMVVVLGMVLAACTTQPTNTTPATTGGASTTTAPSGEATTISQAGGVERTVNLKMVLVAPEERWNFLLDAAKQKFEAANPGTTVQIDAQILPFGDRLTQLRAAATGGTPLDIVSLDQPEVGEFAAAGFTTDLTDWINRDLNGLADWRPAHRAATLFNGRWYAVWAWTDARVLWYWKDLVEQAGVNPDTDMLTWDGYINACQRLDAALGANGVEGCLLIGQPWVADWTLPYVWMNEGDIGFDVNPTVASSQGALEAWIPAFDSQAWVSALEFTRRQVEAGIDPFTEHQFGPAFVARRFATWLGGTWVYGAVKDSGADMSNLGLVAAFPTPSPDVPTATMAGGWTLAIPSTSENPEDAWEFLKAMLDVSTLGEMQVRFGYLPTEESFAASLEGEFSSYWNEGGEDRWAKLQGLLSNAYGRPSFPAWPKIGQTITDMVQSVMFDNVPPTEAARTAQLTALGILSWPEGTAVELHDDSGGSCEHTELDLLISAVTPVQKAADGNSNGNLCTHVDLP